MEAIMKLETIINDPSRIIIGTDVPQDYLEDVYVKKQSDAHAVVFPLSTEEVVGCVQYAKHHDLSIIAKGSGTGLSGATIPLRHELVLDFSKMNKILGLDEKTMTLHVQPGVLLQEIQAYVESKGYFYAPDPGSKHSSIGGNVATNAGGMRAVKYGVTRDFVKEIEVVLASGDVVTLGSLNVKDSSGYDLKDLFIGSEGTLGITTNIKLKVLPKPQNTQTFLLAFDELVHATQTVAQILQDGIDPTAVEFFESEMMAMSSKETGIVFPTNKGEAYLLITLDGYEVERRSKNLKEISIHHGGVDFISFETEEAARDVWRLRDNILTAVVNYSEQVTLDETVPINQLAELYAYTKELEKETGVSIMSFGHAGDGNLHTCIVKGDMDTETWNHMHKVVLEKLYNRISELGGLPSAEHGIGVIKKPYFKTMTDPVKLEMMRSIKNALDPENRLNPGKLIP